MKIKNKNKNAHAMGKDLARAERRKKIVGILNKFLMCAILVGGIYFVGSVNDLSIKGFVLQELKLKSQELNKTNKLVEVRVMELESYENIEKRAEKMKLVKADRIDYIIVTDELVAKK